MGFGVLLASIRSLDPILFHLIKKWCYECLGYYEPLREDETTQNMNNLLSKAIKIELIYMALKAILHFSKEENNENNIEQKGKMMLRRANFEGFHTPNWKTTKKKRS